MSAWLDPLRRALDARSTPVAVFCRDDDAGWNDAGLARLLDVVAARAVPLDLAVIPAELTDERAVWLLARRRAHPGRLGLHQHGWAHVNHEPAGRKCEFGAARPPADLAADIARGRAVLTAAFGAACDPVFTPPWNRCVPALGPQLLAHGLTLLSRDATAPRLGLPGLAECPADLDWSSRTRGASLGLESFGARCAAAVAAAPRVGVLFHHAVMDDTDRRHAGELLALLGGHPSARCVPLVEAAVWPAGSACVPAGAGQGAA